MTTSAASRVAFEPIPASDREPPFWLEATPTTARQFHEFLVDTGLAVVPSPRLYGFPPAGRAALSVDASEPVVLDEARADHPATFVTFHGAVAFCDWLTDRLGVACRLPTAREWQRAALGPHGWRWALGDTFERSRYVTNARGPEPVGQRQPNPYGLFDLTGLVFEWTSDFGACAADVPSRVVKGGSFILRNPENFETAASFTVDELSCLDCVGFRVVAVANPGAPC